MWLLVYSLGIFIAIINTTGTGKGLSQVNLLAPDSLKIELQFLADSSGLLELYRGRVTTPVCEENKCYTIEIDFFWDCIGRFHHFDTIPGKGLTKLDHIPFTTEDYQKLDAILKNQVSLLAEYTQEQLLKDTRSSTLDGITGATITALKESVIDGAAYSCYTLWHIAHGPVADDLKSATRQMFGEDLIKKLISAKDQQINYFLINRFSTNEFKLYLPEVLKTIEDGAGYFAKNAIEKMPAEILNSPEAQRFFSVNFNRFDYFAQVALLEKLETGTLSLELKNILAKEVDERNSYKNDLINNLLSNF